MISRRSSSSLSRMSCITNVGSRHASIIAWCALSLALAAAVRPQTDALRDSDRGRLRAFSEPVSDWYFVLKVYPPGYYTASRFCTVDAPSDASSTSVTCTGKAAAHLHQFALVHSDSSGGPAKTGVPLLLVSRSFGVCGVQPDAPTNAAVGDSGVTSTAVSGEHAQSSSLPSSAAVQQSHTSAISTSDDATAASAHHRALPRSDVTTRKLQSAHRGREGAGSVVQERPDRNDVAAADVPLTTMMAAVGGRAADAGYRPLSCATQGTLSTIQLWKTPGVADVDIAFDVDWLYISVDGQFCTLADTPPNATVGPAAKSVLSCHLAGAVNAPQFQFSAVAFPFAGLNSLGAKGPCGALPAPDDSHDMVCGHPVVGEERQNVFSLILQTPSATIVSGASVGLFIFFDGLVGKALQQCCPMAGLSHMVQCGVLDADAPAKEVPKACWYKLYKVGGKAGSEITDGDAVQIQSIAYSLYCSVSTDGALLCISALPSNASRNIFRIHLPSHLPTPTLLVP